MVILLNTYTPQCIFCKYERPWFNVGDPNTDISAPLYNRACPIASGAPQTGSGIVLDGSAPTPTSSNRSSNTSICLIAHGTRLSYFLPHPDTSTATNGNHTISADTNDKLSGNSPDIPVALAVCERRLQSDVMDAARIHGVPTLGV